MINKISRTAHVIGCLVAACYIQSSLGLCVVSAKASLRAGPGNQHPVTWIVGKNMPLIELEKQGNWYKVKDMDGVTHWAHQSTVSKKTRCVVVKSAKASVRVGPGLNFPLAKVPVVDRYTPLQRLEDDEDNEDWYQVRDAWGQKYWIHNSTVWRPLNVTAVGF